MRNKLIAAGLFSAALLTGGNAQAFGDYGYGYGGYGYGSIYGAYDDNWCPPGGYAYGYMPYYTNSAYGTSPYYTTYRPSVYVGLRGNRYWQRRHSNRRR